MNATDYLTITGPSPPRTFTLPPMTCFIVTFTPSSLPAGAGFQLNYAYQDVPPGPTPTPTAAPAPPPNAVPTDDGISESRDKVCPFAQWLYHSARDS